MKKILYNIFAVLAVAALTISCSEDPLSKESYIKDSQVQENEFDVWLTEAFVKPYNIQLKYRYEDLESDMLYNLAPPTYLKSKQMATLTRHLCLEPYDEILGNKQFIIDNFPKIVFLVGSPAYNNNGSIVLGTAEGGRKITLYNLNVLDPNDVEGLNDLYFKTMHHEFAHILNQTKPYSTDFPQITGNAGGDIKYVGNECFARYPTDESALKAGFITRYSATSDGEDFVELYSKYITCTATKWNSLLTTAGSTGRSMIAAKFEIVVDYMQKEWGIDLDEMRAIVLRRQAEVPSLDLDNI